MNKIYIALLLTLLSLIVVLLFMRREWVVVNEWPKTTLTEAVVTAYSKAETCPDEECITSSGKVALQGIVACPRAIPLGTMVRINGQEYECADRTHKRFDGRFDIFMDSYEEALRWGRQELIVRVDN